MGHCLISPILILLPMNLNLDRLCCLAIIVLSFVILFLRIALKLVVTIPTFTDICLHYPVVKSPVPSMFQWHVNCGCVWKICFWSTKDHWHYGLTKTALKICEPIWSPFQACVIDLIFFGHRLIGYSNLIDCNRMIDYI